MRGSKCSPPSGSAPMPEWAAEEIRATLAPMPDWAAKEIRETWLTARDAGNIIERFRILERMVERLGNGRTRNNPSLVPNIATCVKDNNC